MKRIQKGRLWEMGRKCKDELIEDELDEMKQENEEQFHFP
jgi:hypothetical protein